eukprot:gnl/Chilomastix_cuspidata/130.p1 GENE.gnl/Chilomastix_cuspidata/130~~gnl/Chilomastix_cuspidata/130.p1  ORF type:complete len:411 (+),score=197.26 gnl/Chilomastix_cuspidata/130:1081-2313(+)
MRFNHENPPVIIGYSRTPFGVVGGKLSGYTAVELAAFSIKDVVEKSKVDKSVISEMFLGNVLSGGLGQAPAKQAVEKAGLPSSIPCTLINKVCSSGMKAFILGCQTVTLEPDKVIIVGGAESMSQTPYYHRGRGTDLPRFATSASAPGGATLDDGVYCDGLLDAQHGMVMGLIAEECAAKYGITRAEQDEYCVRSYTRAIAARDAGKLAKEIVPVPEYVLGRARGGLVRDDDELARFKREKIAALRPIFREDGTVTAANASGISDGAAFLVITSERRARALGATPICSALAAAEVSTDSMDFTVAPSMAIKTLLREAALAVADVDFFEINEAFSVVALANQRKMGIPIERLNVDGGAVSLGHPLGASGSRILATLCRVLAEAGTGMRGIAAVCNGGGGSCAVLIRTCEAH